MSSPRLTVFSKLSYRRDISKRKETDKILRIIGDERKLLNKQEKSYVQITRPSSSHKNNNPSTLEPNHNLISFLSDFPQKRIIKLHSHDLNKESGLVATNSAPKFSLKRNSYSLLSNSKRAGSSSQRDKNSKSIFEANYKNKLIDDTSGNPKRKYFKISRSFRLISPYSYSPRPVISPHNWKFTPI